MATKAEYLAQGKTEQQIQDATVAKNTATMNANLGQNIQATNYNVVPNATPQNQGGLSNTQAQGIQDIYKQNQAKGMSPLQAKEAIQADPNFANAKAQYNASPQPVQPTPSPVVPNTPVPIDSGNILSVRANQTPEEKAWQAKQDAFDQARTGVNPAPATQVEKTTTTTPQGETVVKKETPTTPTVDFNVGKGREQDISNNLQEGFKNDPAIQKAIMSGDRDSFNQAYGYDTADESKKKILDYFFQSRQPKSSDEYFNQMQQGISINNPSLQKNPLFLQAKSRMNDLNINAGLTAKELSDQLKNGSITLGSQAYKDLQAKNPQLVQNAEKLNAVNTGMGGKTDTNVIEANVGNNIIKDVKKEDVPNLQNALANNPEVKQSLATSKETKTKMDALQDNYDNLEEDIRAQYKGTGATEGYIQGLISEKSKPIVRQLNTLSRVYSTQLSDLQYYSDIVKADYTDKKAALADERNFAQQKELAQYQQGLSQQSSKVQFEQQKEMARIQNEYKNADISTSIIKDEATGKQTLINSKTGEVLKSLNTGLKADFTTFNNNLYKTDAQGNVSLVMEGKVKPSDIKWTKLDDGMYQDAEGKIHTKQEMDQAKRFGNPLLNAKVGENVGIECGQYARTATGLTATPGGNSLTERKKAFADTNAVPGGLVLFDGGGYDKTYGHIAVVTGVSADGKTITVKESNYNGDNKVTERTIPTTYVSGYYNNTPLAQGGEETPTITDKQFTQFNQMYSKFQSDKGVQAFESALAGGGDLIASLKSANGPGDVGAVFGFMKSLDPASVVKEAEFALAAKSAGVWEQFKNIPANKLKGTILTEDQRKAFGKLAFEYIKSKSKIYDIKYNDMAKILKNQNIPDSYMPTKMSDYIKEVEQGNIPETKNAPITATGKSGTTYTLKINKIN